MEMGSRIGRGEHAHALSIDARTRLPTEDRALTFVHDGKGSRGP
jgi:hypothetical protein